MPSSLARVLSSALDFSSYPPVLVCGTVSSCLALSSFSWQPEISNFRILLPGLDSQHWFLGFASITCLPSFPGYSNSRFAYPPASLLRSMRKYENINSFPISYALQPRLRGRLTLGRLPLPRKPRVSGERVFHPFYRYSCQHYHFSTVQHAFQHAFSPVKNAPLPLRLRRIQNFGSTLSPVTFSAQRH